jgi:3-methyladenine DNA glycosylase AlkD
MKGSTNLKRTKSKPALSVLNSKTQVRAIAADLLELNRGWTSSETISFIHDRILTQKVRFPVLEYFTELIFPEVSGNLRIEFLRKIVLLDKIGSYTIAGKFLQLVFQEKNAASEEVFQLAEEFIIQGDKWYVCDIIGERVFGHSLLLFPVKTLPYLNKLSNHKNTWMVRAIGVAAHYAVKKGLDKKSVDDMFRLLLAHSADTDFHVKKGIGWGAKTVAKFHPLVIDKYKEEIYDNTEVKQWFKTKIKIGLSRNNKYASKYNS